MDVNTIYVIDDEPVTLKWFQHQFGDRYNVRTFTALPELIEAIRRECCDLLITDILMPGASGYEVVRQVRVLFDDMKIIMMSALESEDFCRIAEKHRCDYWQKQQDKSQLTTLIQEALNAH